MLLPTHSGFVDVQTLDAERWIPAVFNFESCLFTQSGKEITDIVNWRWHDFERMHALTIVRSARQWIAIQSCGIYTESYRNGEIWSYNDAEWYLSTADLSPHEFAELYCARHFG